MIQVKTEMPGQIVLSSVQERLETELTFQVWFFAC